MTFEALIESHLPTDWHLANLISLSDCWQVNVTDGEHVAVATGETILDALANASAKIIVGDYAGRLFHLTPFREPTIPTRSLLQILGLSKPINRRV